MAGPFSIGCRAMGVLSLLAASASPASAEQRPPAGRQIIVREQMTIRVRPRPAVPGRPMEWRERRGPRCIPADAIAGAALIGPSSVDVMLRDNRRLRLRLDASCPALDFYRGFYLRPNSDRMICAGRDTIRSRMGGQCEIEALRTLKPARSR